MNKINTSSAKVSKRGFTLIELLVVIGILAILTAAVVLVLNPAELLRQSRDAQRLSDFDALRSAINLYLSTVPTPVMASGTTACYYMVGTTPARYNTCTATNNTSTAINGSGWVPINFNDMATTSVGLSVPLSTLPTDPVNSAPYFYSGDFDGTKNNYELDSVLESAKYQGKMLTDGGSSSTLYEVGNKLDM
jgi:prepilin-type N-terminal cleavage/methylation domain-containing protein